MDNKDSFGVLQVQKYRMAIRYLGYSSIVRIFWIFVFRHRSGAEGCAAASPNREGAGGSEGGIHGPSAPARRWRKPGRAPPADGGQNGGASGHPTGSIGRPPDGQAVLADASGGPADVFGVRFHLAHGGRCALHPNRMNDRHIKIGIDLSDGLSDDAQV